jgi:NDH2 C-terminal domain/Pyridine nucleotide-disulphide oxidoreductase
VKRQAIRIAVFAGAFLSVILPVAQAQGKNEIGLVIGATVTPDRNFSSGSTPSASFDSSLALGAEYDHRVLSGHRAALYGGVDFLASPLDVKLSNPATDVIGQYAYVFLTPHVRVKFYPDGGLSPWLSRGNHGAWRRVERWHNDPRAHARVDGWNLTESTSCESAVQERTGRICVDEYMQVPGYPGVWALGDCAAVPDGKTGKPYPPTAQHALRQGKVLAQNIAAAIRGGEKRPFVFSTIGQLAAIGRRTGVARIFGFNFSGFVAWWLWRSIYLSKLPRFEKKMRVMLDWTLDILFSKDLVQFTTTREQRVTRPEETTAATQRAVAGSSSH